MMAFSCSTSFRYAFPASVRVNEGFHLALAVDFTVGN